MGDRQPYCLACQLFGQPTVQIAQQPLKFHGALPLGILCYCVDAGRAVSDDELRQVFWRPARGTAKKLTEAISDVNTQSTWALRQVGSAHAAHILVRNRGTVTFQWPADTCECDIARFQQYMKTMSAEQPDIHLLTQAYALYRRGPFLGTLAPQEAPPEFDDWIATRRQALEQQYLALLQPLSVHAMTSGDWSQAIDYLQQLQQGSPEEEVAYGLLMLCHSVNGHVTQAQAIYDRYLHILAESTQTKPSETMVKLWQVIQAGRLEPLQARELIDRIRVKQQLNRAPLQEALQEVFRVTGAKSAPILSAGYQHAVQRAQAEAARYGDTLVGTPHLSLALGSMDSEIWPDVLAQMDVAPAAVEKTMRDVLGDTQPGNQIPQPHTLGLQRVLRSARQLAARNQAEAVESAHLWMALLQEEHRLLGQVLAWHGVDRAAVLRAIQQTLE